MRHFIHELQRRNVHRAAVVYLASGWLVLQVTELLAEIYGWDESSLQWLVVLLGIGFVPVIILAWLFEFTTDGIRRDSELDQDEPSQASRGARSDRIIILLLALALTVLAIDRFVLYPERNAPESAKEDEQLPSPLGTSAAHEASIESIVPVKSIAVLPFLDLSPEQDRDYFASGIAEELLNLLTRIDGLQVAARTSSFSFKGRAASISEIAAALNVRYVLDGSVRVADEQLRITAQLIDATTGFHLWSENYDRSGSSIFDIQDDVAQRVADALELTILTGTPRVTRVDPAAHVLVLEASSLDAQGSEASMALSIEKYRQALSVDPTYIRAWVGLSSVYTNMAASGYLGWDEGHQLAWSAAESALQLDPNSAPALQQLAWLARTFRADLPAAATYIEQAIEMEPTDPDLIGHVAVLLQSIGRLDEAIALHEYSVARDPIDTRGRFNLALAYYFAERLDDSARQLERVLALAPGYTAAHYRLGTVRLRQARPQLALDEFATEPDAAFRVKGRALAMFALSRDAEATRALEELRVGWGDQWPSEVAQVHAFRGEIDEAFAWLEKDYQVAGAAGWGEWRLMHLYENLHDDPRWIEFLQRVGVSDGQLAQISLRLPEVTRNAVRTHQSE